MNRNYTAYIERDVESGMYIGTVPGITGARTFAETIDELQDRLKEVIALCLEEMDKFHGGKDLPRPLLRDILREIHISIDEYNGLRSL